MSERRAELEGLREQLLQEGVDVGGIDDILRRMRTLENQRRIGDPRGLTELQESIIPGLKEFEFELRKQLQTGDEPVFLTGSGEVPDQYRQLVEEYYKALSKRSGGNH